MAEQTIDRLSIEINAKANASVGGIDKLAQSIQRLKSAVGGGTDKLSGIAASIDRLKTALSGFKGISGSVSSLAKSLERLQAIKLEGVGAKLSELSNAAKSLDTVGESLQSIRDFGKGVTSMTKSFDKLEKMDIKSISARILELVAAIKPLTNEMIRAGSGVSNFGDQMKSLAQALRSANSMKSQIAKQTQRSRSGTGGLNGLFSIAKIGAVIYGLERVGRAIKGAIGNVNSYIEDMNLFAVSMGSAAREGEDLAQKMQDLLGVDAGQAMRNMGVFRQMTTSFGVAGEKATVLSKNLTQLGYDMASFYNINSDAAFEKLQAGISGETEPLRRLGIDISETRLQQELYNLGIKESVRNLSQADKAQLRYIAIMEQTKNAQADMARTIMSPANALRVLQAQLQITARNIGSIFIPALNAILPYAIAVVKVIGELAARLAQLVGFKMPDFEIPETSLPDISEDLGDIGNEAEKAGKKMNQLISGFDELNVLSKDTGIDKGEIGNILGGIELPEYDPFEGLETSNVDKIVDDFFNKIESIFQSIKDFWDKYFANPFADAWAKIKPQLEALKETFKGIFEDIKTLGVPLQAWFFNNLIPMLRQLVETGGDVISGLLEVANTVVSDVWEALFQMIESFVVYTLPVITDFVTEAIKTFGTLFNEIKAIFLMIWSDAIKPILDLISTIWQDVMKKISDAWDEWGQPIFDKLREAIVNTSETLQNIWNTIIKPVLDQAFRVLGDLWQKHLSPLVDKIMDFALNLIDAALQIYNGFILPVVNWFVDTFGPPIAEVVNFVVRVIDDALGTIIDVAGGIIDALKGIINFVTGVLTGDWSRAWEGIKQIVSGAWDAIKSLFSGTISTLQGIISTFASWFSSAWSAVWNAASSLFSSIWNGMKSTGSALVASIKQIITGFIDSVKSLWGGGWNGIKSTFSTIWDGMKNTASRAIDSIKGFITGLIDKVRDAINWVKDLIGLNKEADRTSQSSRSSKSSRSVDTYSFERSVAPFREQAASFRALSPAPTIAPAAQTFGVAPALSANSDAGAVRVPSYAKATLKTYRNGEYSEQGVVESYQRAIANPNGNSGTGLFVEAIKKSLIDFVAAEYQMNSELIEAVKDGQNVSVQIDGKEVGKVSAKYIRNEQIRTGKNPAMA